MEPTVSYFFFAWKIIFDLDMVPQTAKSLVALVCIMQWRLMSRKKHYSISLYFATVLYFANDCSRDFDCVAIATYANFERKY